MNARLDLWLYVSLLAASLALDILLLPALLWTPGVISQEAAGGLMTLMSMLVVPLLVLWLLATGLLVTAAAHKRWRAVGRGLVVFLLTGLSAVVLQVMIVTPGWAAMVSVIQGVALVLALAAAAGAVGVSVHSWKKLLSWMRPDGVAIARDAPATESGCAAKARRDRREEDHQPVRTGGRRARAARDQQNSR